MADALNFGIAGYGGPRLGSTSTSLDTFTINSDGASIDRVAMLFEMPKADTLTHVGFRYASRAGTPVQHRVGIQSLSSGAPSGTYLGGGSPASATFTPPADNTWNNTWRKIALDNSIAVTKGQQLAVVIEPVGTPNGSNNSTFNTTIARYGTDRVWMRGATQTNGAAWAAVARYPIFGMYGTDVYGFPVMAASLAFLGTNGHREAGRWTPSSSMFSTLGVTGLRFIAQRSGAGADIKIGIWQATTEIVAKSYATALLSTSVGPYELFFDSVATLNAGTEYLFGIERVDAGLGLDRVTAGDSDIIGAFPGGAGFMRYSSFNGTSWTDDDTIRCWIEPILSDITPPASGGGGGGKRPIFTVGNSPSFF